jgi:hypothetical protein
VSAADLHRVAAQLSFDNFNMMQAKRAMVVAIFACIIATVEAAVITYLAMKELPQNTIAIDPAGNVTTIENLTSEVTSASVTMFATEALGHLLSFDFRNYETQISTAEPYFTKSGWAGIIDAIATIVATVKEGQYVTAISIIKPPVISKTAIQNGVRKFKVNMQISLGYLGQTRMIQPAVLDVEIVLTAAPRKQFARGILIQTINIQPAKRES